MDRTRLHKLVDILVIGLCSQLTGGEGFKDMPVFGQAKQDWLKTFLELPKASLRMCGEFRYLSFKQRIGKVLLGKDKRKTKNS